jgi:CubicO group peptidase (beta-lactamase class C family)
MRISANPATLNRSKYVLNLTSMRTTAPIFPIAVSILISSCATSQTLNSDLQEYMAQTMKDDHIVGMSVAILRKGQPLFSSQMGFSNRETNTKLSPATTFALGTTGQIFISLAALANVDQKKWGLDEILPDGKPKDITLRQALGQTSGLNDFTQHVDFDQSERYSFAQLYKMALDKAQRPGDDFNYAESNALLLTQALFRKTRLPIAEVVKQSVFDPAGMITAKFAPSDASAKGYFSDGSNNDATPISPYPVELASLYGAQFTVGMDDMIAFDRAIRANKIISAKTWNMACSPVSSKKGASEFGLGFDTIEVLENEKWVGRAGGTDGFSSCYMRLPSTDTAIIVLMNTDNQDGFEIARGLYEIVHADDELKSQGANN